MVRAEGSLILLNPDGVGKTMAGLTEGGPAAIFRGEVGEGCNRLTPLALPSGTSLLVGGAFSWVCWSSFAWSALYGEVFMALIFELRSFFAPQAACFMAR